MLDRGDITELVLGDQLDGLDAEPRRELTIEGHLLEHLGLTSDGRASRSSCQAQAAFPLRKAASIVIGW